MPSESVRYAASDVGDSGGGPVRTAAHGIFTGVPTVAHPTTDDLDNLPISWIRWRPLGQLSLDQGGDLVFPPVTAEPGIYRFMIHDGTEVIAGYIGQAAKSLRSPAWAPLTCGNCALRFA